jgi:hypothetical protein
MTDDTETLTQIASRLDDLESRFDQMASCEGDSGDDHGTEPHRHFERYCCAPPPPERTFEGNVSMDRRSAILANQWKWLNGTNIKYFFQGGAEDQRQVVRDAWQVWKDLGIGLTFSETTLRGESDTRIAFQPGGSWSVLGKNCRNFPNETTMNFGWDLTVSGPNGLDTAIHEIGHALGFQHEHQNPHAGIEWNREACYRHFRQTQRPPWSRAEVDHNVLNTVDPNSVQGSSWDSNSIMHYSFARGLIISPPEFRSGLNPAPGLSQMDREVVTLLYPAIAGTVVPELKVGELQSLDIAAAEQKNFNVIPMESRWYRFQTFGSSDTLMVLFEEDDNEMEFVIGDDDSGYDRNAQFDVRLRRGRKYQLRIRLYYDFSSGRTHVSML